MKVYHIETQQDYDALMVELEEQGCKWASGDKPSEVNRWHKRGHLTCVDVCDSKISYASLNYYKEDCPDVPIIKYKAKVDEKMKIYHTEKQADYDALMVELEAEGCEWLSGRKPTETTKNWKQSSSETCVKVDKKVIAFNEKNYYTLRYPDVQIIKYKEKVKNKVKIYHTETQADYDALMIELEEQGYKWLSGSKPTSWNDWSLFGEDTCIRLDDDTITQSFKSFYDGRTPITKYKAKVNEKMKFTKENVEGLVSNYFDDNVGECPGNLIAEIYAMDDTPEKVVVPKYIAEFYERVKHCELYDVFEKFEASDGIISEWYFNQVVNGRFKNPLANAQEVIAKVHLYGYTIEPEQLYYIPLPHLETLDGLQQLLSTFEGAKGYFASRPSENMKQRFTKDELGQVPEIYRLFAKPIEEKEG